MIARACVIAAIVGAAGLYARAAADPGEAIERAVLAGVPCDVGQWRCSEDTRLDPQVLEVLKVDDYLNRTYRALPPEGADVSLYIAYYESQRQGEAIHSPQNCLPGAGWQPIASARTVLPVVDGGAIGVNTLTVQKGLDRMSVVYWYQGRGRVVANEYANKLWLIVDSARVHRTNGALVRVVSSSPRAAEQFAGALYPRRSRFLP